MFKKDAKSVVELLNITTIIWNQHENVNMKMK